MKVHFVHGFFLSVAAVRTAKFKIKDRVREKEETQKRSLREKSRCTNQRTKKKESKITGSQQAWCLMNG